MPGYDELTQLGPAADRYVDGEPIRGQGRRLQADLPAGEHRVTFVTHSSVTSAPAKCSFNVRISGERPQSPTVCWRPRSMLALPSPSLSVCCRPRSLLALPSQSLSSSHSSTESQFHKS